MSTIAIEMETPRRDVKTVSFLAFWLIHRYGHRVVIFGSQNELATLVCHRPEVIVLPHVRYARMAEAMAFARDRGTPIALLPSEGIPPWDDVIPLITVGAEEFRADVALWMSWGRRAAQYCAAHRTVPNARIAVTGCPRFDTQLPPLRPLLPTRDEHRRRHGIPADAQVVTWFSSTIYANHPLGSEELVRRALEPRSSADFFNAHYDVRAVTYDHQTMYDHFIEIFARHAVAHPEVFHLVKPHPADQVGPIRARLAHLPNVGIAPVAEPVDALMAYGDVQINWRCSTSFEAWYRDVEAPVITVEHPNLRSDYNVGLTVGNEVVHDFAGFDAAVARYLGGGRPGPELVARRREFLDDYLHRPESTAAESCAREIDHLAGEAPPPRWTWGNVRRAARHVARQLPKGHWQTVRRARDEEKHLDPDEVKTWIDRLNDVFGGKVDASRYELFA